MYRQSIGDKKGKRRPKIRKHSTRNSLYTTVFVFSSIFSVVLFFVFETRVVECWVRVLSRTVSHLTLNNVYMIPSSFAVNGEFGEERLKNSHAHTHKHTKTMWIEFIECLEQSRNCVRMCIVHMYISGKRHYGRIYNTNRIIQNEIP